MSNAYDDSFYIKEINRRIFEFSINKCCCFYIPYLFILGSTDLSGLIAINKFFLMPAYRFVTDFIVN